MNDERRQVPLAVQHLLLLDRKYTKEFVSLIDKFLPLGISSFESQLHFLALTSNGFLWLPLSLLLVWFTETKSSEEVFVNLFTGLCLDVILVATLKAYFRRRRPKKPHDEVVIGMDKFSFPSGHASRAVFIILFFYLASFPLKHGIFSLVPIIFLICWSFGVMLSRVVLERHYLLDVIGGIFVGFTVSFLQRYLFWLGEDSAHSWARWLKYDLMSDWSL